MTTNPYAPPTSDPTGNAEAAALPAKSNARRASFVLAATGFVMFWGAAIFAATSHEADAHFGAEAAAGFGVLLAMLAHLVGIGIVFAAPRGRRMVPALLNAFSLGLIAATLALGLSLRP